MTMTIDSMTRADWNLIPFDARGSIKRYLENGIPPGDFLAALISNDLCRTIERADHNNIHYIVGYVTFFYNYVPQDCWGSPEIYKTWIAKGGWAGKPPQKERDAPDYSKAED